MRLVPQLQLTKLASELHHPKAFISSAAIKTTSNLLFSKPQPIFKTSLRMPMTAVSAKHFSIWSNVPLGPPDAILGITEAFEKDSHASKINLGVGAYRDDQGKPFVLSCVKKAEEMLLKQNANHEYSRIDGDSGFNQASIRLAYGDDCDAPKQNRIAVAQTVSGTGALRVGGVFLQRFYGCQNSSRKIYLPSPTWGNHHAVFRDCGLETADYRYFAAATNGLDFAGLLQDVEAAPGGSVFLFHACAHNPTGVDPTPAQWQQILQAAAKKQHVCFFDMAYQGFASGDPDRDAFAVRQALAVGNTVLLAQSYAKNFGLYGERAGALSIVAATPEEKACIESQLKLIIRPMYSNPPIHGARIVAAVLGDDTLRREWLQEVRQMADRILNMRQTLHQKLVSCGSALDWSHITAQIGMFCFTGLAAAQVDRLKSEFHVYLTRDGRISIAGINSSNIAHLSNAIHAVTKA